MEYKNFDFRNPDYAAVVKQRLAFLREMRANPECIPGLKLHYRDNPADFIADFGTTFDPRNADIGNPTLIPMVLFPKQREFIEYVMRKWKDQKPGLIEKSRDMGISWCSVGLACTLCLFYEGVAIGFGSRKEEYVDKIGSMKPLLPKARMFIEHLPVEFRGGWRDNVDAPYMRINFPETGSMIVGEAGDQIGRGDRETIYFVDEAAYLERAELVEASLSQTTNCRIDMSSVNGMNNVFARKRWGGKVEVFIFDWRDDPRKDQAWYDKQCSELDETVVAQEIDRDYQASVSGLVIPAQWVKAAIGARAKLGLGPSGERGLSLDVADEGVDKNAVAANHGIEINYLDQRSGKGSDLFKTTQWAFEICDELGIGEFDYDADGMGAGVRGDARVINEARIKELVRAISVIAYRGSESPVDPDGIVEGTLGTSPGDKGRTNQDYFANKKAQTWWGARRRFQKTFRWITQGIAAHPDEIVSLDPDMPLLQQAVAELSQPTYSQNGAGKMLINKKPDGQPSPNLGDVITQRLSKKSSGSLQITPDLLTRLRGRRR